MKKPLKYALIAATGYAIYSALKRDDLTTNEALRHSVDRRLSVENQPGASTTRYGRTSRQNKEGKK